MIRKKPAVGLDPRVATGFPKSMPSPELKAWRSGDKTYSQNPANSGLIAGFGEISVRTRMRGGAERTRTACQARSRYRTGLSRVIR